MSDITIFHNNRCSNSRGALQILRDRGIEPNIVDYIATPLTAPELSELVAHMGVPVIFLTTESDNEIKQQAKAAGATGWLTKPFDPESLVKIVRKVLGR